MPLSSVFSSFHKSVVLKKTVPRFCRRPSVITLMYFPPFPLAAVFPKIHFGDLCSRLFAFRIAHIYIYIYKSELFKYLPFWVEGIFIIYLYVLG